MLRSIVVLAAALATSSVMLTTPAAAQGFPLPLPFLDMRGTPEDERACSPDAVRLCRHLLDRNDSMVVLQCFQANHTRLSPPCRGVLAKYGQLPQ